MPKCSIELKATAKIKTDKLHNIQANGRQFYSIALNTSGSRAMARQWFPFRILRFCIYNVRVCMYLYTGHCGDELTELNAFRWWCFPIPFYSALLFYFPPRVINTVLFGARVKVVVNQNPIPLFILLKLFFASLIFTAWAVQQCFVNQ